MEVTANTEIRKLASGQICELVQILEFNGDWKKLMSEIRRDCFNLNDEFRKYNFQDISLIEDASVRYRRPCSEIFLEEWGTSGKRRPDVKLLHDYLIRTELWRAVEYVAEKLLKEPAPERPLDGPVRKVSLGEIQPDFIIADTQINPYPSIHDENTATCGNINDKSINIGSHVLNFAYNQNNFVNCEDNCAPSLLSKKTDQRKKINDGCVTKIPYHMLTSVTEGFSSNQIIGSGAFGSVYQGKLNEMDVAIKVLNEDALEHFEHELIVLSSCIEHRNLLPPLAVSDDNILCLVYKFMPNGSLEDRLASKVRKKHPLTWQKRVSIALDITEGMKYLHSLPKPIIHRDIKSSNILLDENDTAKIGDFGLVRVKNNRHTSVTSTVEGTNAYMSPEALRGLISLKMDVFSFGMILLELLTGLPILDESKGHLMDFLDEAFENNETLESVLDPTAGQWNLNLASRMNELAWKCLENQVKLRLNSDEINLALRQLHQEVNF